MLDRVRIRPISVSLPRRNLCSSRASAFFFATARIVWLRVHRVNFHHRIERLVSRRVVLVVFQILSSVSSPSSMSIIIDSERIDGFCHLSHHRDGAARVISFVFLARTQRERVRETSGCSDGARVVVLRASFRRVLRWCHIFVRARVCVFSLLPSRAQTTVSLARSQTRVCGKKELVVVRK